MNLISHRFRKRIHRQVSRGVSLFRYKLATFSSKSIYIYICIGSIFLLAVYLYSSNRNTAHIHKVNNSNTHDITYKAFIQSDIYGQWLRQYIYTNDGTGIWQAYKPLKPLINAWSNHALVDWHYLVPAAKPGDSGELHFIKLVRKEKDTMQMLLHARDEYAIGPINTAEYNPDLQYCQRLADKCVIHRDEAECVADGYCIHNPHMQLCMERQDIYPDGLDNKPQTLWRNIEWNDTQNGYVYTGNRPTTIEQPTPGRTSSYISNGIFNELKNVAISYSDQCSMGLEIETFGAADGDIPNNLACGISKTSDLSTMSQCDLYLDGSVYVTLPNENAAMFWHFIVEHITPIYTYFQRHHPSKVYILTTKDGAVTTLYDWYYFSTTNCWRPVHDLKNRGRVCVDKLHIQSSANVGAGGVTGWAKHVMQRIGLSPDIVIPHNNMPLVGFIQRQDKRTVLNEPKLLNIIAELGAQPVIIAFENLPVHLQVVTDYLIDIIIGIHGSGLLNVMFMRSGSTSIQLVTVGLSKYYTASLATAAAEANCHYYEVQAIHPNHTITHFHFAGEDEANSLEYRTGVRHDPMNRVSASFGFVLLVQQDTIIPAKEFTSLVQDVLMKYKYK
jgi:hypothetical protein